MIGPGAPILLSCSEFAYVSKQDIGMETAPARRLHR
jgi:hypothetical protein